MSPRSEEYMEQARERLAAAREELAAGRATTAVSVAYYAMLYAARAALSERDEYAKTHGGTWHLFHDRYVATGAFDERLHSLAVSAQVDRERGDYEAVAPGSERAREVVEGTGEFVAAVEEMLD